MVVARWIILSLGFFLAGAMAQAGDKHLLCEKVEADRQARYVLGLKLQGTIQVASGAKTIQLELAASAGHAFHERALTVNEQGEATRVARHYDTAEARVTVHGNGTTRALRPDRRLLVANVIRGKTVLYSPAGPMTREELELTGEHFDVLAFQGVFPRDEVASGAAWDVPPFVVQALLGYDGLIQHSLRGEFRVEQGRGTVLIKGTAAGITRGSEVTHEVDARVELDLTQGRWTQVTWKQLCERRQGPIDPAARTNATITVERRFDVEGSSLADDVVASIPVEPNSAHLLLSFKDAKSGGEFLYDRAWHVVAQTEQYAVLRLLERGELIAQLNVTPGSRAKPGEHYSPEDVRKHVQSIAGFSLDQVVQHGEVPGDAGYWIYRLSVAGRASELDMLQNVYAVAGPQGHQILLTFATEMANVERLGGKDLSIVGTVTFPK